MDRYDRVAWSEHWQNIVRCVEQLSLRPHEVKRYREVLSDRVLSSPFRYSAEVVAQLGRQMAVFAATQEDVICVPIDPRELTDQVTYVGADSKVVQLPDIDRNSHYSHYNRGRIRLCP